MLHAFICASVFAEMRRVVLVQTHLPSDAAGFFSALRPARLIRALPGDALCEDRTL